MKTRSPWLWVPTLYFAEGIPYFVVNNISTIMFKKMGMSNTDMALYTSLLYLPWLIKPFWSPFVDIIKTKRWWIVVMEILMVVLFAGLTFTLPGRVSLDTEVEENVAAETVIHIADTPDETVAETADSIPVNNFEAHSVSDGMSFKEAFVTARAEVGAGGAFVWHGRVFNTYRADDQKWIDMSPGERYANGKQLESQVLAIADTPVGQDLDEVSEEKQLPFATNDREVTDESGKDVPVGLFTLTLILFWITAFASATHDIAADGFYMLGLDQHDQSFFVGIRSTFYRLSNLFVQGALVVFAGLIELRSGSIPHSWRMTLLLASVIWAVITFYHLYAMPRPAADAPRTATRAKDLFREFGRTFVTFFSKKLAWLGIVFMLLYRLPEAFALKIVPAFLVDPAEKGGMGLSTVNYGLINNTVGVVGIVLGGILGGIAISRRGLKKCIWPMALSLALPCAVYLYMAFVQSVPLWVVGTCVFIEQFGYGYGFTAYMLYMIYVSEGEFKTSHYSLCTAFMAASMMLPGLVAGLLQEQMGYAAYFGFVMATCVATILAVVLVRRGIPAGYGCKTKES